MATIAENLQTLSDSKQAIKDALVYAGMQPTDDMTTYAQLIKNVADTFIYGATANGAYSKYAGDVVVPANTGNTLKAYAFVRLNAHRITVPGYYTYIPVYAFGYNYAQEIVLGEGVEELGDNAFAYNYKQNAIIRLPSTITTMGNAAFGRPNQLLSIILSATTPPAITSTTFTTSATYISRYSIYVPDASLQAYKTATNWSAVESRIFPLSEWVEPS